LSWILFKLLLYDDLVGVVTSRHMSKMEWNSHYSIRHVRNPLLYVNFTALSSIRPKLLPIKVLHCVNREFRVFLRKMVENIKFSIRTAKLMQMMPKHIFWPIIDCSGLYATEVLFYAESVSVVTSGHATKMAVTPFDPHFPKTPAIRKVHDSIFYRTGVIAH